MTDTYVYIFATKDGDEWRGPVKVGLTGNVAGRLAAIRTACPHNVGLFASLRLPSRDVARDLERCFHRVKKDTRMNGEWFDMEPRVAYESLCYGLVVGLVYQMPNSTIEEVRKCADWAGADVEIPESVFDRRVSA